MTTEALEKKLDFIIQYVEELNNRVKKIEEILGYDYLTEEEYSKVEKILSKCKKGECYSHDEVIKELE